PLPTLNVEVVVLTAEADRRAAVRVLSDQADDLNDLADVRRWLPIGDAVPALVEALESGAEAEREAAARRRIKIEGGERGNPGATHEGERDRRAETNARRVCCGRGERQKRV